MKNKIQNKIQIENSEKKFIDDCVKMFLKNRDIAQISVQNEYGGILIVRNSTKEITHAIGFTADFNESSEESDDGE